MSRCHEPEHEHATKHSDIFASLSTEERNEIIASGIDAWLDKKWLTCSKWGMRGILAILLAQLAHFVFQNIHWR